ncbi:MAG: hypothetical protein PHE36_08270 [Novosphingobium sp.]|nr:hypothetical protein [Novosphingobium sp.]
MYEENDFAGRVACPPPSTGGQTQGLRPLVWPELVARFAAVRDLRHAMTVSHEDGQGSFDRSAALRLHDLGQGKPPVNPDGLGNGKSRADIIGGDGINAWTGDRGTE